MKKDEQSTAIIPREDDKALVALVDLEEAVQGNEAALIVYGDPDIPNDEKLQIIKGMLNIEEQMEGVPPTPPKCELSHGGYTFDGEASTSEFQAIILYKYRVNSFFINDESKVPIKLDFLPSDVNKKPPLCTSVQALVGSRAQIEVTTKAGEIVKVFGLCDQLSKHPDCWLNNFGVGGGNAKPCANKWDLWIWRIGDEKPHFLSLPSTSLVAVNKYSELVTKKKKAMHEVITSFRYEKKDDGGSQKWGVVVFGPHDPIPKKDIESRRHINRIRIELKKEYGQPTNLSDRRET